MSSSRLLQDEFKPWANIRVNEIKCDDGIQFGSSTAKLAEYEEFIINGEYVGTAINGPSPPLEVKITKIGPQVTITYPSYSAASAGASVIALQAIGGGSILPSSYWPIANDKVFSEHVQTGGTYLFGSVTVTTTGLIVVSALATPYTLPASNFAAVGTNEVIGSSFTYNVI